MASTFENFSKSNSQGKSNEDLVPVVRRAGRRGKGANSAGGGRAGRGLRDEGDGEEVPREPVIEGQEGRALVKTYFRNARGACDGDYAKKPLPGEPKLGTVYFLDKHIKDHPKMKTLKAIMRANWPITRIDVKTGIVARREFIDKCVKNFYEYYDYPQDMTKEEGDKQVEIHITSNIRQNMFSDRDKADKKVEKCPGTTRRDFVPKHLEPLAWDALCDYWESSDFLNRSVMNKKNRSCKKLKHTTGSTAIVIFQENMEKRPLDPLELFEMAHSKKHAPAGTDLLPPEARKFKADLAEVVEEYKRSEEAISQPLQSLAREERKKIEAKLILKATK